MKFFLKLLEHLTRFTLKEAMKNCEKNYTLPLTFSFSDLPHYFFNFVKFYIKKIGRTKFNKVEK